LPVLTVRCPAKLRHRLPFSSSWRGCLGRITALNPIHRLMLCGRLFLGLVRKAAGRASSQATLMGAKRGCWPQWRYIINFQHSREVSSRLQARVAACLALGNNNNIRFPNRVFLEFPLGRLPLPSCSRSLYWLDGRQLHSSRSRRWGTRNPHQKAIRHS
jgi:hypothetical protein